MTHVYLRVVQIFVDEFEQVLVSAAEVILVRLHELWHGKLAMHHVNRNLGIDDFAHKVVQALVQLFLVISGDDLDVLHEIREVQANEIDSWVTVDILKLK